MSSHWLLVLGLILAGLGTGAFVAPNNSVILSVAPPSQQGITSGILATFRYIDMMAGITIGGSLFDFLTRCFIGQGANMQSAFLEAFPIVMGVGVWFGIFDFICAYFMINKIVMILHKAFFHSVVSIKKV